MKSFADRFLDRHTQLFKKCAVLRLIMRQNHISDQIFQNRYEIVIKNLHLVFSAHCPQVNLKHTVGIKSQEVIHGPISGRCTVQF